MIIEEVIARLDPVILQPTYIDKDGKLQPFGDALVGKLGEPIAIPPAVLEVQSATSAIKTETQIPIGGKGKLRMGRLGSQ